MVKSNGDCMAEKEITVGMDGKYPLKGILSLPVRHAALPI